MRFIRRHKLRELPQVLFHRFDVVVVAVEPAPPQLFADRGQRRAVQPNVPPLSAGDPHAALRLVEDVAGVVVDVKLAQSGGVHKALVFSAAVILDHGSFRAQEDELKDIHTVGEPVDYLPKPEWADAEAKAPYILGSLAIGVRNECTDLTAAINKALADMGTDGTREKILTKYGIWSEQQAVLKK